MNLMDCKEVVPETTQFLKLERQFKWKSKFKRHFNLERLLV